MKLTKETGLNVSLSALASIMAMVPILWFVAKPIVVSSVSVAMAEDLTETVRTVVQEEMDPLKGDLENLGDSFRVILVRDINTIRRQIARLEARRAAAQIPGADVMWTAQDAEELEDLRIEREGLQSALTAMDDRGEDD